MRIIPHTSVGEIKLGEGIRELIAKLDDEFNVFKRFPGSNDTYAFDRLNLHIEVDSATRAIRISVFRPEKVYLDEVQLLNKQMVDLELELQNAGHRFSKVDAGLENELHGIVLVEVDGFCDGVEVSAGTN